MLISLCAGGWLETVRSDSPGVSTVNDMVILGQGLHCLSAHQLRKWKRIMFLLCVVCFTA